MAVNKRDVKLILLREINVQKDVLFTRQMGAVAERRKDAWERISEMAWRHGYTQTMRPEKTSEIIIIECGRINSW